MFWEIYVSLCAKQGQSPNAIAQKLDITSGTVTGWKNGRLPQNATLKKIADHFGVSVDYLLGKESDHSLTPTLRLTPHEIAFILAYRERPELHEVLDRLLDISPQTVAKIAARDGTYTETAMTDEESQELQALINQANKK